ncbi:MAG: hypothetical protein JW816_03725 [Candidatus Buchananbacteria bacterium]|nr:hypothetical protein [Candidatus Buchananbacteria bacterium]
MRLYFAAPTKAPTSLEKQFARIVDLFYSAGVTVLSNRQEKNVSDLTNQDLEKMESTGENMIEAIDGIVIEGTKFLPESGYLIAIGLAHKKPILFLTQSAKTIDKNLLEIKKEPTAAKLLNLKTYTQKNLDENLLEFLQQIEQGDSGEKATIKFTLRMTKKIERYLQWKTHNTKLSKADYLREVIEKIINQDQDFQKFIADNS